MQMYSDPHFESMRILLLMMLSVLIISHRVKCALQKSHLGAEFMCKMGISLILESLTVITNNAYVPTVPMLVQHGDKTPANESLWLSSPKLYPCLVNDHWPPLADDI